MKKDVDSARHEILRYQHRMHPQIAAFARELIYSGEALRDANTIEQRDTGVLPLSRPKCSSRW